MGIADWKDLKKKKKMQTGVNTFYSVSNVLFYNWPVNMSARRTPNKNTRVKSIKTYTEVHDIRLFVCNF